MLPHKQNKKPKTKEIITKKHFLMPLPIKQTLNHTETKQ